MDMYCASKFCFKGVQILLNYCQIEQILFALFYLHSNVVSICGILNFHI